MRADLREYLQREVPRRRHLAQLRFLARGGSVFWQRALAQAESQYSQK